MIKRIARCQCEAVAVETQGDPDAVVACHCLACQKRTGSVLGVGAYYPPERLTFSGETRTFARSCDSGETFLTHFCPRCGTSVYWRISEEEPQRFGIAVGSFADPGFPQPERSVWEQSQHAWIKLEDVGAHFTQGRASRREGSHDAGT
jgi:hypothetical protein